MAMTPLRQLPAWKALDAHFPKVQQLHLRKLFAEDNTRFFVGVVEEYDDRVIRLRGFPFHLSPYEVTGVERHGEQRTRVLSMSGDILLYMLPRETDLEKMQLRRSPKSLQITDGGAVTIDLSEWLMRA